MDNEFTKDATEEQARQLSPYVSEVHAFVQHLRVKYPRETHPKVGLLLMAFEEVEGEKLIATTCVSGQDKLLIPSTVSQMMGNTQFQKVFCKAHAFFHEIEIGSAIKSVVNMVFGDREKAPESKKPVDPQAN